jgi:hypothetical protein
MVRRYVCGFGKASQYKDFGMESRHIRFLKPQAYWSMSRILTIGLAQSSGQKTILSWLVKPCGLA